MTGATRRINDDDLKRALLAAGEMERWDKVRTSSEALERVEEAERGIEGLLKTTPPSHVHTELGRLLRSFTFVA